MWTTVPSPNVNVHNILQAVSAVAANDIWTVGATIKDPFDGVSVWKTLIEHWDGTSWKVVRNPKVGTGASTQDGVTGTIPIRRTLVLRWNGVRWRHVDNPNVGTGDSELSAVVTPAGSHDVWASGGSASETLVERFTR